MNVVIGQVPFLRSFRSILRVKKKKRTWSISHISINSHRNRTGPRGQDHSVRSGSQSKHRIHYIIPAQGAVHIIILIIKN